MPILQLLKKFSFCNKQTAPMAIFYTLRQKNQKITKMWDGWGHGFGVRGARKAFITRKPIFSFPIFCLGVALKFTILSYYFSSGTVGPRTRPNSLRGNIKWEQATPKQKIKKRESCFLSGKSVVNMVQEMKIKKKVLRTTSFYHKMQKNVHESTMFLPKRI